MRRRQKEATKAPQAQITYDPPKKPYVSAVAGTAMARAYEINPLILSYDTDRFTDDSFVDEFDEFISDEETVVVALKHIKGIDVLAFEELYGVPLQTRIAQLNAIRFKEYAMMALVVNPDLSDDERAFYEKIILETTEDQNTGITTTPSGAFHGSVSKLMLELLAFVFSRCGIICGKGDSGKYEVDKQAYTAEDFLSLIDLDIFNAQTDTGLSTFEYVLDKTNIYVQKVQQDEAEKDEEQVPEKN